MPDRIMTLADSAWLHLERPENLMMVVGLLLLDRNPDHLRLEKIVEERLLCYDRFRMLVTEPAVPLGPPRWQRDPHFDLKHHVSYESLPGANQAALRSRVENLMSRPLTRGRPLWDILVIEDIEGGSALLVRLHHAIADGIALMKVLLTLAGTRPEEEQAPFALERSGAEPLGAWETARRYAHDWLQEGHDLLFSPNRAAECLHVGWETSKALARVLALSPDNDNALRGRLGVRKVAAVSEAFSLADIKEACGRLGCTVNDFLMATLAGCLGRYLSRAQHVSKTLEIRTVVPVDLRRGDLEELGNRFGLVFLTLPVGDPDPAGRLRKIHQSMLELKGSPEALVTFDLLSAVGALPTQLEQTIVEWFGNKATAVVTSLHGPDDPLYIGEALLTGLMYWVPQSGRLGLGVSMISYAGGVRVGVAGDAGLLPDPELMLRDFDASYQEMLGLESL